MLSGRHILSLLLSGSVLSALAKAGSGGRTQRSWAKMLHRILSVASPAYGIEVYVAFPAFSGRSALARTLWDRPWQDSRHPGTKDHFRVSGNCFR